MTPVAASQAAHSQDQDDLGPALPGPGGTGPAGTGPDLAGPGVHPGAAPSSAVPSARPRNRFPAVAGAIAALWALLVGLGALSLLVLGLWVLAPNGEGGAVAAWRGVGLVWLGAHQVPMLVAGRELTLLPLGAVIPALLLLRRAGQWAGRIVAHPSPLESATMVAAGAALYGAGAAAIAWVTTSPATGARPYWAGGVVAAVAVTGLSWGVGAEAGWSAGLRRRLGESVWRVWLGALTAFHGLFALGSALVCATLIVQFPDMVATMASLNAGLAGELGLTLLGIFALPTMAIWGMAVAVGAPVSFGGAGELGVFGGDLGALPALPVLAALPAQVPASLAWVMVVPVALGWLAGRVRWRHDLPTWSGVVASAALLMVLIAALVGAAGWLASGSLGGQRMAEVGPHLVQAAGAAAGLVGLGFLLEAGWQALALAWQLHQAEVEAVSAPDAEPREAVAGRSSRGGRSGAAEAAPAPEASWAP